MGLYKKILIATDLAEPSLDVLRTGFELARTVGAEVLCLHVTEPAYEPQRWFIPFSERETEFLRDIAAKQKDAAQRVLNEQVGKVAPSVPGTPGPKLIVKDGIPADTIVHLARDQGADLIVMGTHGRRGMQHALLGSIAERVLRTSTCPVLTVRTPRAS